MESKKWKYKEHFHAIGMTGDYDGYYEVANGDISLCTNDDPEDITETENALQRVVKALNESGCKFYCNTTTEHKLHVENMELRYKIDELKERSEKMETTLKNIAIQKTCEEQQNDPEAEEDDNGSKLGDSEYAYDHIINDAREAVAWKEGKEVKDA